MTALTMGKPGATPTYSQQWQSIDWKAAEKTVSRLQARIAKAVRKERGTLVNRLQRQLVTSRSAKLLAVKKVTTNKGKNTPGIDGTRWKTAKQKLQAVASLTRKGYKPQPLRRKYIPKANGKQRGLGIPTMQDRAMQALYAMALLPVAETLADPDSYGFRPNRCVQDAIRQCHIVLAKKSSPAWILEGDIKACFDQISHEWMIEHIPMDKKILRMWLEAGYFEDDVFYETTDGTPQGGTISPILANMALDGLEALVKGIVPPRSKVNFVRYADDFIVTADNPELLENVIKPAIKAFMSERGLELSEEKTKITHISQGFDFLGHNIRKYDGKLLIKPQKEKVKNFLRQIRMVVKKLRYKKVHDVITEINRKVIGWTNFYRSACSSRIFSTVDHHMFQAIWRELKRRHPKKGRKWIKKTYFTSKGSNNWVFFGVEAKEDRRRAHYLYLAATRKIRRHVKIPKWVTPFDQDGRKKLRERARYKAIERNSERLTRWRTTSIWQRYPKQQLELFPAGLQEQP